MKMVGLWNGKYKLMLKCYLPFTLTVDTECVEFGKSPNKAATLYATGEARRGGGDMTSTSFRSLCSCFAKAAASLTSQRCHGGAVWR